MSALYRLLHRTCNDKSARRYRASRACYRKSAASAKLPPGVWQISVPAESQWLEEGRSASLIGVYTRSTWAGRVLCLEFRRIRGLLSTGETMALGRCPWAGLTMQWPSQKCSPSRCETAASHGVTRAWRLSSLRNGSDTARKGREAESASPAVVANIGPNRLMSRLTVIRALFRRWSRKILVI